MFTLKKKKKDSLPDLKSARCAILQTHFTFKSVQCKCQSFALCSVFVQDLYVYMHGCVKERVSSWILTSHQPHSVTS